LAELPQRGPSVEHSASNTDRPLNEAAFDPDDREMSRRINVPEPAEQAGHTDDDDDLDDDVMLYDDADADDVYRAPVASARPDARRPRRTRWAA
jgi:hypothetical protein